MQNFTSVVGPNGSGKSNVIDAMLFVFGFKTAKVVLTAAQDACKLARLACIAMPWYTELTVRASLLQLRLSKVSELIHNSTNHKDLDSASVMVHFVRIIDLVSQAP